MAPPRDRIAYRPAVPRVGEIAVEHSGGRAQAVACLQFVLIGSPAFDSPLITQIGNDGVGGLGTRGRKLRVETLETRAEGKRQALGQQNGGQGLEILARAREAAGGGSSPDGIHGRAVPLIVIAVELETQMPPGAAD